MSIAHLKEITDVYFNRIEHTDTFICVLEEESLLPCKNLDDYKLYKIPIKGKSPALVGIRTAPIPE